MKKNLKICWLSAGVSSFIAGYANDFLTFLDSNGNQCRRKPVDKYIYIDIKDQHPDSMRFIKDCENVLGKEVEILQSEYNSVENVIRTAGMIGNNRNNYYPCTNWLKKRVRKEWEYEHSDYDITYIWGFDRNEQERADRLCESMPEFKHEFPLIDKCLSKQDCHSIMEQIELKRPYMYDLGYQNNNCVGCVKGGMWYWNKIRKDFPDVFEARAKLERDIGHSILKQCYLDELEPDRGRKSDEISTDCGIMCYMNMYF